MTNAEKPANTTLEPANTEAPVKDLDFRIGDLVTSEQWITEIIGVASVVGPGHSANHLQVRKSPDVGEPFIFDAVTRDLRRPAVKLGDYVRHCTAARVQEFNAQMQVIAGVSTGVVLEAGSRLSKHSAEHLVPVAKQEIEIGGRCIVRVKGVEFEGTITNKEGTGVKPDGSVLPLHLHVELDNGLHGEIERVAIADLVTTHVAPRRRFAVGDRVRSTRGNTLYRVLEVGKRGVGGLEYRCLDVHGRMVPYGTWIKTQHLKLEYRGTDKEAIAKESASAPASYEVDRSFKVGDLVTVPSVPRFDVQHVTEIVTSKRPATMGVQFFRVLPLGLFFTSEELTPKKIEIGDHVRSLSVHAHPEDLAVVDKTDPAETKLQRDGEILAFNTDHLRAVRVPSEINDQIDALALAMSTAAMDAMEKVLSSQPKIPFLFETTAKPRERVGTYRERVGTYRDTGRTVETPVETLGATAGKLAASFGVPLWATYGSGLTQKNTPEPPAKHRIYVAGASKEPKRVRAAIDLIKSLGFEVTLDWLADIEAHGKKPEAANEGLTHAQRVKHASADLDAVRRADVVWYLCTTASQGAPTELGAALALGKKIFVSGPADAIAKNIFTSLAREFASDLEAATAIAHDRVRTERAAKYGAVDLAKLIREITPPAREPAADYPDSVARLLREYRSAFPEVANYHEILRRKQNAIAYEPIVSPHGKFGCARMFGCSVCKPDRF